VSERREVLRHFIDGIDAAGRPDNRAFLASVRALGASVDITGLPAWKRCASSAHAAPRVDILQNIGRALRPNPHSEDGAVHHPGLPAARGGPAAHNRLHQLPTLIDILPALRSHSKRMIEELASRALTRDTDRRRLHVRPAPAAGSRTDGGDEEETSQAQALALMKDAPIA
jgi:predicted helicase